MEEEQQQQQQQPNNGRGSSDRLESVLPPLPTVLHAPLPPIKRPTSNSSGSVTPRPLRRPPSRRGSGVHQISFSELREILAEELSLEGASPTSTSAGGPGTASLAAVSVASQQSDTATDQHSGGRAMPSFPRPALAPSSQLANQLDQRCKRAIAFLEQLHHPSVRYHRRHDSSTTAAHELPLRALRFAKGIAFQWTVKAGLGVSWCWGHGFVMARLEDGRWSAPSFFKVRQASIGITAGAQTTKFLHTLQTSKQLRIFNQDRGAMAVDVAICLGVDPIEGDVPVRSFAPQAKIRGEEAPHTWTVVDGALMDLSFRAGFLFVDEITNRALYGDLDSCKILAGGVAPPPQFGQLYNAIAQLAADAPLPRTKSKYEVARQQSLKAGSAGAGRLKKSLSIRGQSPTPRGSSTPLTPVRSLSRGSGSDGSLGHSSPEGGNSLSNGFLLFPGASVIGSAGAEGPSPSSTGRFRLPPGADIGGLAVEEAQAEGGTAAGGFLLFPEAGLGSLPEEDQAKKAAPDAFQLFPGVHLGSSAEEIGAERMQGHAPVVSKQQ